MIDPEDANYVCTLSAASLAKAKAELFEDPKQRLGAVQTLRKWIKDQKHLTCRTDTDFLLQVLRTAKFSQLRAREIIETILTVRTKLPKYLVNLDSHDPAVLQYIDQGVILPLPKPDKDGRYVMLLRIGLLDPADSRFNQVIEVRASMTINALFTEKNEDLMVNGSYLVFDMTGFTAKHVARSTFDSDRNANKIYQDCTLGRMKGLHFYNGGAFFEMLMGVVRPFMKKKFLERISVHSTMETLYKVIPMELWPDEYLPDDYTGPSAGSIKSITDNLKKRLLDPKFRERLLDYTNDRYKIDEKIGKPLDIPRESFRKLTID
jgi:hypothetical protein